MITPYPQQTQFLQSLYARTRSQSERQIISDIIKVVDRAQTCKEVSEVIKGRETELTPINE
jgi:hypothetical protein